jgi:hypothetical protein
LLDASGSNTSTDSTGLLSALEDDAFILEVLTLEPSQLGCIKTNLFLLDM